MNFTGTTSYCWGIGSLGGGSYCAAKLHVPWRPRGFDGDLAFAGTQYFVTANGQMFGKIRIPRPAVRGRPPHRRRMPIFSEKARRSSDET